MKRTRVSGIKVLWVARVAFQLQNHLPATRARDPKTRFTSFHSKHVELQDNPREYVSLRTYNLLTVLLQ